MGSFILQPNAVVSNALRRPLCSDGRARPAGLGRLHATSCCATSLQNTTEAFSLKGEQKQTATWCACSGTGLLPAVRTSGGTGLVRS